jgi:hypothetical protein
MGTVKFSLNTMHGVYATFGQPLDVPKLPFDYDTFLASHSENTPITFRVDKNDPRHYLVQWNDIANEVFWHRHVWS